MVLPLTTGPPLCPHSSGTILAERMLPNLDEKYQDGNRPMVMVQKEGSILNAPEFLSFLESLRFFQDVGIVPNRVPWILAEFDTSMILFLLSIVMMRDQKICCFHNRKIEAFVFSCRQVSLELIRFYLHIQWVNFSWVSCHK